MLEASCGSILPYLHIMEDGGFVVIDGLAVIPVIIIAVAPVVRLVFVSPPVITVITVVVIAFENIIVAAVSAVVGTFFVAFRDDVVVHGGIGGQKRPQILQLPGHLV